MVSDETGSDAALSEGLRARKKRIMRQLISDTATEMMLAQGFDAVRVADVAEAVGVSEKTVYNYFPTKESLVLDREEGMAEAIREALGPGSAHRSPVDATVEVIRRDLQDTPWKTDETGGLDAGLFVQFWKLLDDTPSLRAAQGEMMGRLVRVAAEALAERAGVSPDDPEPVIAADALLGLWRVQYLSLRRHLGDTAATTADLIKAVISDVERAARLIDSGLWSFNAMVGGNGGKEQLRVAAESAQSAGRQVAAALRQARTAWSEMQALHEAHHHAQYGAGLDMAGTKRKVAEEVKRRVREEMQAQRQAQRDAQQAERERQRRKRG